MKNNNYTIRFIYGGSMIVLNDAVRYALSTYFIRRNLRLNSNFIKVQGETYYEIPKVIVKVMDEDVALAA